MKRLDSEILAKNIESRMLRDFEEGNVSGVSVLVAQSGKVVYKRHFGTTSPDGSLPVSDGTIYRLASMTKPVTAAAIMILCDRGLLSLDDPIERYLPAFSSLFVAGEDSPISER